MQPLLDIGNRKARVGIFLSGGGSNARTILERHVALGSSSPLEPVFLATDNPDARSCGARGIGQTFDLPVIELDIREFYRNTMKKRHLGPNNQRWVEDQISMRCGPL